MLFWMHLAIRRPPDNLSPDQGIGSSRCRAIHGHLGWYDIVSESQVFRVIPFKHVPSHISHYGPERQAELIGSAPFTEWQTEAPSGYGLAHGSG